jgi:hypothetical protein
MEMCWRKCEPEISTGTHKVATVLLKRNQSASFTEDNRMRLPSTCP